MKYVYSCRYSRKCVRGRKVRTCLLRCALSQYWYSFSWPSWRQKYQFGPCLHYRSLKKVWNCLFLLYLWCQQEPCRITCFCRLIDLLYFSKNSWWTRFTSSDRFYHDEWLEHHICRFDKHLISFHAIIWNTGFKWLMDSPELEVSAETNPNAHTGNEYTQKKTEDRSFRGNQSLAFGDILFERYVWESLRVAHFFTHSREAPSLVGRLNETRLARGCPVVLSKLLNTPYKNVFDCCGKGGHAKELDTLLLATPELITSSKLQSPVSKFHSI